MRSSALFLQYVITKKIENCGFIHAVSTSFPAGRP